MFWSYLHYKSIFFIQVYATVLFWKDGFGTIVHSINLILGVCPIFLCQKGVSCTLDTNFQFRSGTLPKSVRMWEAAGVNCAFPCL